MKILTLVLALTLAACAMHNHPGIPRTETMYPETEVE